MRRKGKIVLYDIVMTSFYERLFELLDEGKKLVLPTEQAARAVLVSYVRARGKAIEASSVIAFDKFKDVMFPREHGQKPVDCLIRILFSKSFVDSYSRYLTYFIPTDKYPEINERMVYYIASALPSLEEGGINSEIRHDVEMLKAKYHEFLEKSGCYEPSFISGLTNRLSEPYVLVLSSSSASISSFYSRLKDRSNMILLNVPEQELGTLVTYDNEKQELRNTFLQIKELIKDGVSLDSIAISSSGYDRLKPYLEREAYLLDVPLMFMCGQSALGYPGGRILTLLKEIYDSSYDIESLKKLLLTPSLPLRDVEGCRRFILNSIEMGIRRKGNVDRYPLADVNSIYHDLSHYIDNINETDNPDYLINQVKSLFEKLLAPEQFEGDDEDERVLSYLMDSLIGFSSKIREFRALGLLDKSGPIFSLFLKYAEKTIYVPKERTEGVRVYPLSEAVGIYIPYHFVITLNEDEGRNVDKTNSYLSDYELSSERGEIDVTRAMLLSYQALSDKVFFSAAFSTYNGYSLPLTEFRQKETAVLLRDSISDEHLILKNHDFDYDLYPVQKLSFESGCNKALKIRRNDEDLAGNLHIKWPDYDKNTWRFSSSQIDKYIRCPFLYALDNIFQLSREREYEINTYPAMEIGSRLHKVIELYFKNGGGDVEKKVEEYLNLVLDLWQRRLTLDRKMEEKRLGRDVIALSDQMREYVYLRYMDGLVSLISLLNERGEKYSLEENIKGKIGELNFTAFLDCVLIRTDDVDIFDFKTTRAPTTSMQFDVYRILYESITGKKVSSACYAIIREGKIKRPVIFRDKEDVLEIVNGCADAIEEGDFHGSNNAKSCQDCNAKGICRRRFFVR